jgi:hypothetical protein
MRFEGRDDGEYRIHAGSLELSAGHGHLAAVVVNRCRNGEAEMLAVYRDTELSTDRTCPTSDQALQHALKLGVAAVALAPSRHIHVTSNCG